MCTLKKSGARFGQSCVAPLPRGSDQEEEERRKSIGRKKQNFPLEMSWNDVPEWKHICRRLLHSSFFFAAMLPSTLQ